MKSEIRAMQQAMESFGYVAEPEIATAVYLAKEMGKPLLIEGDAGVGKTEVAKVLARILDTELIRLQCYEGLDVQTALYEWDYPKQLLTIRIQEREKSAQALERTAELFRLGSRGRYEPGCEAGDDDYAGRDRVSVRAHRKDMGFL